MIRFLPFLVALAFCAPAHGAAEIRPEPVIVEAEIAASQGEAWRSLISREGAVSFFGPDARIEPVIGGAYEIYFLPDNPPGLRGTEGVRILAMEDGKRLLIGWNAPVPFGPLRPQETVVEFTLSPRPPDRTLITVTHSAWGRGPEWQRLRDYFASAWPAVLGRLQYRFDIGPVDWTNPPDGAAYFRPSESGRAE
jgi:uncharacterized protein YndB with AHSA1/START domain